MTAFYHRDGDHFVAGDWTRGPWSRDHQHGGPPSALAARAIEAVLPAGARVARMIVELPRPVPVGALKITAELGRGGRRVISATAQIAVEGKVLMRASAIAVRELPLALPPAPADPPPPARGELFRMPFFRWSPAYHDGFEMRLGSGAFGTGRMALWARMLGPLVDGETPSPLVRTMILADSGNGVSLLLDPRRFSAVNPDLVVHLHRYPEGEWICLDAETRISPGGVGMAESRLHDADGPFARGAQALVVDQVV